jgi:hypothetical protein
LPRNTSRAHIARLRSLSYASVADKVKRRDIETYVIEEPDGASYQLEILFLWRQTGRRYPRDGMRFYEPERESGYG